MKQKHDHSSWMQTKKYIIYEIHFYSSLFYNQFYDSYNFYNLNMKQVNNNQSIRANKKGKSMGTSN